MPQTLDQPSSPRLWRSETGPYLSLMSGPQRVSRFSSFLLLALTGWRIRALLWITLCLTRRRLWVACSPLQATKPFSGSALKQFHLVLVRALYSSSVQFPLKRLSFAFTMWLLSVKRLPAIITDGRQDISQKLRRKYTPLFIIRPITMWPHFSHI